MKLVNFGAMVIGKARAKLQQKVVEAKVTRFGPMVLGTKVIPGTNTPAPDSVKIQAAVSVARLKEILAGNPAYFVTYYSQELTRPGGPRRGALRVFREVVPPELQGRAEVIALIDRVLDLPIDASATAVKKAISGAGAAPVMTEPEPDADGS